MMPILPPLSVFCGETVTSRFCPFRWTVSVTALSGPPALMISTSLIAPSSLSAICWPLTAVITSPA